MSQKSAPHGFAAFLRMASVNFTSRTNLFSSCIKIASDRGSTSQTQPNFDVIESRAHHAVAPEPECQRPALRGRRRCRLHGGLSPGAPRGVKNGNYKNGDWTAEAIAERKWLRTLVQAFGTTKSTDE